MVGSVRGAPAQGQVQGERRADHQRGSEEGWPSEEEVNLLEVWLIVGLFVVAECALIWFGLTRTGRNR